ncbi:hypothetical protein AVEN_252480-1 [Araneus ventricosus]|uniref:Uncharacterized protein n=1 Tax=Araneus ventricosus TaxID=182803 RepID=A0A4Y2AT09_ARAVE|nr:hypothetical protein AVEN_252480-1 [Araneus ventricosus]
MWILDAEDHLTCCRPSDEYQSTQEADATPFAQRHFCPVFGRAVDFPLRTSHVLLLEIELLWNPKRNGAPSHAHFCVGRLLKCLSSFWPG